MKLFIVVDDLTLKSACYTFVSRERRDKQILNIVSAGRSIIIEGQ